VNLLILSTDFPPEVGSAPHLFYELARKFVQNGHKVTFFTGFPRYYVNRMPGKYKRGFLLKEQIDGIDVLRLRLPSVPRNIPVFRGIDHFVPSLIFLMAAGLIRGRIDAILVYSPPLSLGLTALFLRRFKGAPVVLNVQDLFPQNAIDLGLLRNSILIRAFRTMEHFLYRKLDRITVHSKGNKDHVVSMGASTKKVAIIPNWVDMSFYKAYGKEKNLREDWNINGQFVVSFAGIIGYSQDLDVIIESARKLQKYHNIKFLLIGDGVEKERLQDRASALGLDNVTFLPMQPREIYPSILHISDICLVTLNRNVTTPVVPSKLLSIMAAGKPVLATLPAHGDAPRIIDDARCGYSYNAGDSQSLVQGVLELYKKPFLRRQFGENGRNYAIEHFTLDACVRRYEELFKKLRVNACL